LPYLSPIPCTPIPPISPVVFVSDDTDFQNTAFHQTLAASSSSSSLQVPFTQRRHSQDSIYSDYSPSISPTIINPTMSTLSPQMPTSPFMEKRLSIDIPKSPKPNTHSRSPTPDIPPPIKLKQQDKIIFMCPFENCEKSIPPCTYPSIH
jgi:hypothetical protein